MSIFVLITETYNRSVMMKTVTEEILNIFLSNFQFSLFYFQARTYAATCGHFVSFHKVFSLNFECMQRDAIRFAPIITFFKFHHCSVAMKTSKPMKCWKIHQTALKSGWTFRQGKCSFSFKFNVWSILILPVQVDHIVSTSPISHFVRNIWMASAMISAAA